MSDLNDERRVVVVGSGPAGASAAAVLAEAGVDVLLLEAGAPAAARGLTARLGGLTLAKLKRPLTLRSEGLSTTGDPGTLLYEDLSPGGLSNHWSCAVPRFSREDFLDARRAGEAWTWPVDYDDLAPWYDRVEPWLRIAGAAEDAPLLPAGRVAHAARLGPAWSRVEAEARRGGRALVPLPYAYGASTTVTWSGTVFNSFVRLVRPLARAGRVAVRCDAHVSHLEWSGRLRRAAAVVFRDGATGREERAHAAAVVLAAGAVNTTRILLRSTSADFPAGLGNTHGVLGRWLHDHPLGKVEIALDGPVPVRPPAYLTRAPLERSAPLYAAAGVQWSSMRSLVRSVLTGRPGLLPQCGFNLFGTMAPSEASYLALDAGRPCGDGAPGTELHVRHPPESRRLLEATRDELLDLLARAGLRPRVRMWLVEPAGEAKHFGGSCRMHASPRHGMLDAWSRLHAVPNVVVADSAAFTTGPEKNPALTAMALAARASRRLADDLRAGRL